MSNISQHLLDSEQLMQFVEASDWHSSKQFVQQHPELLTPNAEKLLQGMLEVAAASSDTSLVSCINAHGAVLSHFRERGATSDAGDPSVANNKDQLRLDDVRHRYCGALDALATGLRKRYRKAGRVSDLTAARNMHATALSLSPDSSPIRAELWDGLALDVTLSYQLTSNKDDLDAAITAWRNAVILTPLSREYGADYRINLANMLRARFALDNNQTDIIETVVYLREALGMLSPGSERHGLVESLLEQVQRGGA